MSIATQTTTPHQTTIMTDDTDLRNITPQEGIEAYFEVREDEFQQTLCSACWSDKSKSKVSTDGGEEKGLCPNCESQDIDPLNNHPGYVCNDCDMTFLEPIEAGSDEA